MGCSFCGHSTPHGCWDAAEAARCGNMPADALSNAKKLVSELEAVERIRNGPTKAEIEKAERRELARLKKKYEKR